MSPDSQNSDNRKDVASNSGTPVHSVTHVVIANRELEAYLRIEPPRNGGRAPTYEDFKTVLSRWGITYNLDEAKLNALVKEPIYQENILVARGVAPENGVDGEAHFLFETEKRSPKPKENADGTVDFRDLGIVQNVKKGQVLCEITLPTQGTPGISVKGKEVPQRKGKPILPLAGKNTEMNEIGTAVLSKVDGQVEFDGYKIHVMETFYVSGNVDHSTGNIKVAKNLVIQGMILPGFTVEAGGDIQVMGTVESAVIKAGGNIRLQSGITGSELSCGGDLKSRFIENCNAFVRGDIQAEYIFNSNIKCGKNLKIVGMIAKIIGGTCVVGQNIEANIIGSASHVRTRLELGTDPTIVDRQQELLAQVSKLDKQIESIKPLLAMLLQLKANNRLTPDKVESLNRVSYSYDASVKMLEDAKNELEILAQSMHVIEHSRVICKGTIFPGTTVVIGSVSFAVANTIKNCSLYLGEGEIRIGAAV